MLVLIFETNIPKEMQDQKKKSGQECLLFGRNHAKGSLIVYYNDMVLLFSQINLEYLDSLQDECWTLIHKFDNILNISNITSMKMEESYYGKLLFIINNKYFLSRSKFLAKAEEKTVDEMIEKEIISGDEKQVSFEGLFTIFQESKPIYHPQLLKQLYSEKSFLLRISKFWKYRNSPCQLVHEQGCALYLRMGGFQNRILIFEKRILLENSKLQKQNSK